MASHNISKPIIGFATSLFLVGLVSRMLPLFGGVERIFQQFPTEDGYLMLTIARNIALGFGMSTADGSILTNGTQPLTTFVWALGYLIFGGDRLGGVVFAHLYLVIVSSMFAFAIYKLLGKVFGEWQYGKCVALAISALTFASPQILPHTMNFLETGPYLCWATFVIYLFVPKHPYYEQWSYVYCVVIGMVLGILFLIRIDSVFLIASMCLSYLYYGFNSEQKNFFLYFKRVIVFGSVSVVVGSPWLIYNYFNFGSVMPISGQALSAESFAPNAPVVPSTLVEYLFLIMPIPQKIQENPAIIVVSVLILLTAIGVSVYSFKNTKSKIYRTIWVMGGTALVCYITYYGLFFGAKHFVARYLSISVPFFCLFMALVSLWMLPKLKKFLTPLLAVSAVASVTVVVLLNYRIYRVGIPHQHIQVVNWVQQHVPDDVWVGAVQTGTLGYFHDKTINLDGKVNPDALKAKRGEDFCADVSAGSKDKNCLMNYIVGSKIDYLVDWHGIAFWADIEPLGEHFELVVNQSTPSLAVIKRFGAAEKVGQ